MTNPENEERAVFSAPGQSVPDRLRRLEYQLADMSWRLPSMQRELAALRELLEDSGETR
jgi:hypothetical protein